MWYCFENKPNHDGVWAEDASVHPFTGQSIITKQNPTPNTGAHSGSGCCAVAVLASKYD